MHILIVLTYDVLGCDFSPSMDLGVDQTWHR